MVSSRPFLLRWVSSIRVEGRDGVAKVPGRDTMPGPCRRHPHSGAPGAHVHDVRNLQCALVDHRYRADRRIRGGPDREGGGVLSGELGGLSPCPCVAARGLHREPAFSDQWDADWKR